MAKIAKYINALLEQDFSDINWGYEEKDPKTFTDPSGNIVQVRQLQKASWRMRRDGLYRVKVNNQDAGYVEKAYHMRSYHVGTPGRSSQKSFSSLKGAVNYCVDKWIKSQNT